MYGWIYDCFQCFVEKRYGPGSWEKIMQHRYKDDPEELPPFGGFIRHKYYPDALSVRVFVSATQVFQEDFAVILEAYGVFFIEFFDKTCYSQMLRSQSSSLQGFLNSVNRIHANLQIALPELVPPDLLTLKCPDDPCTLLLLYRSKREGLGPLTQGVVKACAREFLGVEVEVVDSGSIPSHVDVSCPSYFRETFAAADEAHFSARTINQDSVQVFNNVQLFRIKAVDPALTHKLFDKCEDNTQDAPDQTACLSVNRATVEKGVCPFSGQPIGSGEQELDRTESLTIPATQMNHHHPEEEDSLKGASNLQLEPRSISFSFEDFKKIAPFYIILSGTPDDDRLRIDVLSPGVARKKDVFPVERSEEDLYSDDVFEFYSPPLQHTLSALKRNMDTPLIISILEEKVPKRMVKFIDDSLQNRRFLFNSMELDSNRILLFGTPLVRTLGQLAESGFNLAELSTETRDLVCLTEHFVAEVSSSKKLDIANKSLVFEKKKQLKVTMDSKLRKQMMVRLFFIFAVFCMDVVDVTTDWLGLGSVQGDEDLAFLETPYFVFLAISTTTSLVVCGIEILEMGGLSRDLYRNELSKEVPDVSDASYEAKAQRLDEINGEIKTGILVIVLAVVEDVTAIVISAVALNASGEEKLDSFLFFSLCISLVMLGFKLRTIEFLVTNIKERIVVTKEKEDARLNLLSSLHERSDQSLRNLTGESSSGPEPTEDDDEDDNFFGGFVEPTIKIFFKRISK